MTNQTSRSNRRNINRLFQEEALNQYKRINLLYSFMLSGSSVGFLASVVLWCSGNTQGGVTSGALTGCGLGLSAVMRNANKEEHERMLATLKSQGGHKKPPQK
jgi:hypothetical protein